LVVNDKKGLLMRKIAIGFFLCAFFSKASAVVLFSSAAYPGATAGSWTISGPSAKDDFETATQFITGGADSILESATVLVQHEGGINNFSISVLADSAGQPGAVIDTVTGLIFPSFSAGGSPGLVTGNFLGGATLSAGVPYWLLVSPGDNSEASWYDANAAPVTPIAYHPASGGSWTVLTTPTRAITFRVEGSSIADIPEPAFYAALFTAFGLMAYRRYRYRK